MSATRERAGIGRLDLEQERREETRRPQRADRADRHPIPPSTSVRRMTIHITARRRAPSAIRRPISCVCCATEYPSTP